MKKLIAIVLSLMLCVSVLSVAAMAAPEGLESLAIVGTGIPGVGEWDPADPAGDMEEVSESVFVKEVVCPAGTEFKFKVAGNDAWVDSFNFGSATIVFGEVAALDCSGGSSDMSVSVDHDCTLKITVDLNPMANGEAATILVEELCEDADEPETDAPETDAPETDEPEAENPQTGDMSIAAVAAALLVASAGLVAVVTKKEN